MKAKRTISALLSLILALSAAVIPAAAACPFRVDYCLRNYGVGDGVTAEMVKEKKTPQNVPEVEVLEGYTFLGWTLEDPEKMEDETVAKLVDPTKVTIEDHTTFYAVYESEKYEEFGHEHYIIGYPNGNFGPADSINRASVATIIARSCLEGFEEGKDYGLGGYTDVAGHWAQSAIAFCTMHDVFTGYEDDTFRPNRPITRQELATVVARLAGLKTDLGTPFKDADQIHDWAKDGVYTAYANGWVTGYTDNTFRPLTNVRRDETVRIFNGYLNRGVDAEGLADVTGYITWPDVPVNQWAYYEVLEASNDHTFYWPDQETQAPPEHWTALELPQA